MIWAVEMGGEIGGEMGRDGGEITLRWGKMEASWGDIWEAIWGVRWDKMGEIAVKWG